MLGRRKDDQWFEDLLIIIGILTLFFLALVLLVVLGSIFWEFVFVEKGWSSHDEF